MRCLPSHPDVGFLPPPPNFASDGPKLTPPSCFNNCPNDPRQGSFQNQQVIFCTNASLYQSKATPVATGSGAHATPTATSQGAGTTTATGAAPASSKTGAAGELVMNTGGVLLAVAGAVAAVL